MPEIRVAQTGTQVVGELYVGDTHVCIQAAIDYAISQGGGKVFIEKGIYAINSALTNCGLYLDSNIEIYGEGVGTVLKPGFVNNGYNAVISIIGTAGAEKENVYIHDLLIGNDDINGSAIGKNGIYCSYVGKAQTTGLTSGIYSRYDSTTVGVNELNKTGIKIENCIVQNNSGVGIYLEFSSNNTATSNTVQNNGSAGIYLYGSNNTTVISNTAQNNNYGIYIFSSRNNTVTSNTVQNNASYGINLNSATSNTVTSNTVQNNNNYGIYIFSSSNITVTSNIIQNNSSNGIYLNSASKNTVSSNTVQNNGSMGMQLYNSSNNIVTSNTIQNNSSNGILLDSSTSNNTIASNTIQNNGNDGIKLYNSTYNSLVGNNTITNTSIGINITSGSNYNVINGNFANILADAGIGNDITENVIVA